MNNQQLLNEVIANAACAKLQELTGLPVQWLANEQQGPQVFPHGHVRIGQGPSAQQLMAMVQMDLRSYVTDPKVFEAPAKHIPVVMVGSHGSEADRIVLRRLGMNYLEITGNCCIKLPNLFILIDGQAPLPKAKPKRQRAFSKAGLKVIFLLLNVPEAINWTVREIAELAGTSTGNVSQILNALQLDEHIIQADARRRVLTEKAKLLEKWVQGYHQRLRPTLDLGRYRFSKADARAQWKDLALDTTRTCWGGEAAGALLTNYLHPGELALYTTESRLELIQRYGLVPDENGDVHVLQRFWNPTVVPIATGNACPPVLAYADLINARDSRLLETAHLVKEKHLHGLLS